MTVDGAVLVADNEFVSMFRQIVGGIPTNEDTLMIDEIDRLGPEAEYLTAQSTLDRVREISAPKIMDRGSREEWESAGRSDMYTRARREANRILNECEVEPLPNDVAQKLDAIVAAADEKYAAVH